MENKIKINAGITVPPLAEKKKHMWREDTEEIEKKRGKTHMKNLICTKGCLKGQDKYMTRTL